MKLSFHKDYWYPFSQSSHHLQKKKMVCYKFMSYINKLTTMIDPSYLGAWLGNRSTGECIFIPGVNPMAIEMVNAIKPEKLAQKLLGILFTL